MKLHEKIEIVANHLVYEASQKEQFEEFKWLLEQVYDGELNENIESDFEPLFNADSPYNTEKRSNPNLYTKAPIV